VTDETRDLGLMVCRGIAVSVMLPTEGMEEIANPFAEEEAAI
jgi:U6 snRNA-associated Sm-like protein LSm7